MAEVLRKRLTARKPSQRIAAPDDSSGHNPNTPIKLYDLKPNSRFIIGEEVIPLDEEAVFFKGLVLGHVAEDRVLVQFGPEIIQMDVDEILPIREYAGRNNVPPMDYPMSSLVDNSKELTRSASLITLDEVDSYSAHEDPYDETDKVLSTSFDSLPEDQDPQEEIDNTEDSSEEVTILDLGSLCGEKDNDLTDSLESELEVIDPETEDLDDAMKGHFTGTVGSRKLRHHSDLVSGLLGMPNTASFIRQAADVVDASEDYIKNHETLDDVATLAIKNATTHLLNATDHLRKSGNKIAKKIASEIEEDYSEALSLPVEE